MTSNKLVSAKNAHTIIEEVLLKFAEQYESPYSYMRRADEPLIYQLSEARQDLTEDCLATIERLVLERLIGADFSEDPDRFDSETGACSGCDWFLEDGTTDCPCVLRNRRNAFMRQALTQLLRGGEK